MALETYKAKRDFSATPEPRGDEAGGGSGARSFVVQEHQARAHHFDFRLELDGVLVSWAVPKGPSLDTHDKRLAVHVEDHPLEYASFEGIIPPGEYGAGTVIVWDRGTWTPQESGDPQESLAKGELKITLHGEKLMGRWVLVRLRPRAGEKRENWLLIKEHDEFVRPAAEYDVTKAEPESVMTSRTIEQVRAEEAGEPGDPPSAARTVELPDPATVAGARKARMPSAIEFELCRLVREPPPGDDWIAEVKYDGYRASVFLEGGSARAFSRSGADWTDKFAPVAHAAEKLAAHSAILDGEVVAFDGSGISRFQLLQEAFAEAPEHLAYACFDLLYLNGYDLRGVPLIERKRLLSALLGNVSPTGVIRFADHVAVSPDEFYQRACEAGLEGVVMKRSTSTYSGKRSGAWVKVKCKMEQEFVIIGYTEPSGSRVGFGSLLLGYYEGDTLVSAGRAGTGFSDSLLADLHKRLVELETDKPPIADAPKGRGVHWVKPKLVAEVEFQEWTHEHALRHPVFKGLREDKAAREVVREAAEDPPTGDTDATPTGDPLVAGVRISNPGKKLFPASDVTKLDLARFYERIAPLMLPHVAERGLTLRRCPSGGTGGCFWQRHDDVSATPLVRTFELALPGKNESERWLYVADATGLAGLAQLGVAEIHIWGSRIDAPMQPDRLVFDLDPGPELEWEQIAERANVVREELQSLGFDVFVKTTGGKGLHVVVPIEPIFDFERMRAFTKAIVDKIVAAHPDEFIGRMAKADRTGKIFIDYLRNSLAASAVAPYSTRARDGAPVAVPLTWDELAKGVDPLAFTIENVLERVARVDDPWAEMSERQASSRTLRAAFSATS